MPRIYKTGKEHKSYKHGMTHTRFYKIWIGIKSRCLNKNDTAFKYYGARKIKLCKCWYIFENFYKDMYPSYKESLTIDRIDNEKDYCKKNCRWATWTMQQRNSRSTRLISFNGKIQSMIEWANELEINYQTLSGRLNRLKWSTTKALTVNR